MWWRGREIQTVGLPRGRGGAERSDGHPRKPLPPLRGPRVRILFLRQWDLSQQVKFSRLQAKRLAFVAGRLTDSRRSAGPPGTGLTISAWLSQTTSRTRTRASLGNPSAPLRPGIASGSGAYSISP